MDSEFYAEGVLNVYSFLREIVVYLRKTNGICEGEKYESTYYCDGL